MALGILLQVIAVVLVGAKAFRASIPVVDLAWLALAFWLAGLLLGGVHL